MAQFRTKTKWTLLIISLVIIILVGWAIYSTNVNSKTDVLQTKTKQELEFVIRRVQTSNAPRVQIAGGNNTTYYETDFHNFNTQKRVQEELLYALNSDRNFPNFKLQSIVISSNDPIHATVKLNISISPWSTQQITVSANMSPILMENKTGPQKFQ